MLYSDGGGKRAAALNPIYGADKILRFLAGIARKNPALLTVQARAATVNGLAGLVMREEDGAIDTFAFEHDGAASWRSMLCAIRKNCAMCAFDIQASAADEPLPAASAH